MGKYVKWYFSGSTVEYSDWCKTFEPVADSPISDFGASDVRLNEFLLGIPSPLIFTVSVVDDRILYGPSSRWSNFKYNPVCSQLVAVAENIEQSTKPNSSRLEVIVTLT